MLVAIIFGALAGASPPPLSDTSTREIDRAIAMGRFEQARRMISAAGTAGIPGNLTKRPLAELAFAAGRNEEALQRLTALIEENPNDALLFEQAVISALRNGRTDVAARFADRAVNHPSASWRAWNAKAILADRSRDWVEADRAYAKAEALSPGRAEIANNLGWSRLLRGDWTAAADAFEGAASIDPRSSRVANNLDLARAALAQDLPTRSEGETSAAYAARLNDAGVAAQARGEIRRAQAAFAQAIVASGHWYARAGTNLALLEGRK
ncbi:MAG: tetratricopeptide repeat protein [Sphingomonas sp.]|nr:tetratricopeptide repeat protein [Sphingomonas sp.]